MRIAIAMAKRPTWVLVAHRAGARIFAHPGPGRGLALEREIDHPEGRKLSGEIDEIGRASCRERVYVLV